MIPEEPTRLDLLAELSRLDTLARALQDQRSQVVFRLGRIARERERIQRHLAVVDEKREEGSSA